MAKSTKTPKTTKRPAKKRRPAVSSKAKGKGRTPKRSAGGISPEDGRELLDAINKAKAAERGRGDLSLEKWARLNGFKPVTDLDALVCGTEADGRELLAAIAEAEEAERRAGLRP